MLTLTVHPAIHVLFLFSRLHESKAAEHTVTEAHLLRKRIPHIIGPADQHRPETGNGSDQQEDTCKEKWVIENGQPAR